MKQRAQLKLITIFLVLLLTSVLSGCVPLIVYEGQIMDESTRYSSAKLTFPSLAPGMGRLFVYVSAGGPSASWAVGIGPAMNGFIVIDEKMLLEFLGGAYFYVDLPAGQHVVNSGEIASSLSKIRKGNSSVTVTLTENEYSFVRVDLKGIGLGTKAYLTLVDKGVAELEMAQLRRQKDYKPHDAVLVR